LYLLQAGLVVCHREIAYQQRVSGGVQVGKAVFGVHAQTWQAWV
jgi:hypothetical protein